MLRVLNEMKKPKVEGWSQSLFHIIYNSCCSSPCNYWSLFQNLKITHVIDRANGYMRSLPNFNFPSLISDPDCVTENPQCSGADSTIDDTEFDEPKKMTVSPGNSSPKLSNNRQSTVINQWTIKSQTNRSVCLNDTLFRYWWCLVV